MALPIVGYSNISISCGDISIPVIKVILSSDATTASPTFDDYAIIMNNCTGYVSTVALWASTNFKPDILQTLTPGDYTYGGDTGFKLRYTVRSDYAGVQNFYLYYNNAHVSHCTVYTGYANFEVAYMVIFTDENNIIYTTPTYADTAIYALYEDNIGIGLSDDVTIASVLYTENLHNTHSYSLLTKSANNITDDIEGEIPHETPDPYESINGEEEIPDSELVPVPNLPPLTTTSTGIIGLFSPTSSQMQQLADFMWTDFGGTGTDIKEVLEEVVQALKRAISNPLDYVVGLNIIPSQGLSKGSSKVIRFGFVSSGVSMPTLSNQYFTVDCGSLHFNALCGDTFLDYAPYSKFSIYLPFIGVKDVDANDFVGHTIGVKYHGDTVTGGITAYVTKDGSVMYQYSGCCALSIPLSSDGWGSTIAGAVQVATSLVSGGIAGGSAGVATAAAKGAASVAANPSLLSPQVSHSGSVSGSAGCMGVLTPFVIRESVRFHSTSGFNKISGYPSYYYKKLSDVSGYTVVLNANLQNVPCTNTEMDEIDQLLRNGVIL